jgi:hypothetical protein
MEFFEFDKTAHTELLEEYFKHPNTPINNSTHKAFKTHLYDGTSGLLGLLVDNNEIVAVSSAVVVTEHGIKSCKYPHRLHVRTDYSHVSSKFIDEFWDPLLFRWLEQLDITRVYCTFNEDNDPAFIWAALRHSRRTKKPMLVNDFGKRILLDQEWKIHSCPIIEMNTWQHLIYSSPDSEWFYHWREEKRMSSSIVNELDTRFERLDSGGWRI